MIYCSQCGSKLSRQKSDNDGAERLVCNACGTTVVDNPRVIVASIIECRNKVLLCKRAIKPRLGYWALPGGYMENNETVEEAAIRETKEETNVDVDMLHLYALFNCPLINQVYIILRGSVHSEECCSTAESSSVKYFDECTIPWGELSYSVMNQALDWYFNDKTHGRYLFRTKDVYEVHPE